MEQLKRLLQKIDDFQQRQRWLAFPVAVAKKYGEDQAGQKAALLPTTASSRCSRCSSCSWPSSASSWPAMMTFRKTW